MSARASPPALSPTDGATASEKPRAPALPQAFPQESCRLDMAAGGGKQLPHRSLRCRHLIGGTCPHDDATQIPALESALAGILSDFVLFPICVGLGAYGGLKFSADILKFGTFVEGPRFFFTLLTVIAATNMIFRLAGF